MNHTSTYFTVARSSYLDVAEFDRRGHSALYLGTGLILHVEHDKGGIDYIHALQKRLHSIEQRITSALTDESEKAGCASEATNLRFVASDAQPFGTVGTTPTHVRVINVSADTEYDGGGAA